MCLSTSDTLKSGKEIQKMADDAQELFRQITINYKGTPWAIPGPSRRSRLQSA